MPFFEFKTDSGKIAFRQGRLFYPSKRANLRLTVPNWVRLLSPLYCLVRGKI